MKTVERVLSLLELNKDTYLSGEEIAENLGISRNAVWKAVNELRKTGYDIEAVNNKGYKLAQGNDIISKQGIEAYLKKDVSDHIYVFDSLDSTNNKAKELALKGAEHGSLVVAPVQTGGRGRKDHAFFSPKGGLYMSIILDPKKIPFKKNDIITAYVGISVCDAIERLTGIPVGIKGINDLYTDDKKICGILIEAGSEFDSDTLQWLVAGIGINFDSDIEGFPEDIKRKAASLFKPGRAAISKNELIAGIMTNILSKEYMDEEYVMKEFKERKKD